MRKFLSLFVLAIVILLLMGSSAEAGFLKRVHDKRHPGCGCATGACPAGCSTAGCTAGCQTQQFSSSSSFQFGTAGQATAPACANGKCQMPQAPAPFQIVNPRR